MVDDINADTNPTLASLAAAAPVGRERAELAFRTGLDALIAGLRSMLTTSS